MANEDLAQTLDKLHEELSGNPQLDEHTLRSMRSLLDEIQVVISRFDSGKPTEDSQPLSIAQRLQEMISDFEVRHPQLTSTLSQIADRLTDMGI